MEYIIGYLIVCLFVAWGYSDTYMGFFAGLIISIIFTPIIGFIILLFIPSKKKKQQEQERLIQAISNQKTHQQASTAEEIEKLASLKERGVITMDEFEKQKAKILS